MAAPNAENACPSSIAWVGNIGFGGVSFEKRTQWGRIMNSINHFERVLADFKEKESPEAILVVGEDPWMIRLTLAWPNVLLGSKRPSAPFSKQWNEVERWNWLWGNVHFTKKDVYAVVGRARLDTKLRSLIANRILYPDGTVHSYVVRFLRSRVIKLLEKKPVLRQIATKV